MPSTRRRWRTSLAALMAGIAVFALLLMVVLPVLRHGWPTCIPARTSVHWLAAQPGRASCADCHQGASPGVPPAPAMPAHATACLQGTATAAAGQPVQCAKCHTVSPGSTMTRSDTTWRGPDADGAAALLAMIQSAGR